jgi:uncharacterized glyoxalase superfamily protein PhnB
MSKEPQTIIPYLLVSNGLDFLDFMQNLFNAEIVNKQMHNEKSLMHAELKVGNTTIMCGEAGGEWEPLTTSLFVYVANADESYAKALELGCVSIMSLSDQPYGRTCGVKDIFGNVWWITSI